MRTNTAQVVDLKLNSSGTYVELRRAPCDGLSKCILKVAALSGFTLLIFSAVTSGSSGSASYSDFDRAQLTALIEAVLML